MSLRLSPGKIAKDLFVIDPDRDERASQIYAETLLLLAANDYTKPDNPNNLRSPKLRRFGLRSLALGRNFLENVDNAPIGNGTHGASSYGHYLSLGKDFQGSENLALARDAIAGLIDPQTARGQPGTWLLYPFHENFLWYDARLSAGRPWSVRKVYMRGSGITVARLLLDGPTESVRAKGSSAVGALKKALKDDTPLAGIADRIERPLSGIADEGAVQDDERDAWDVGADTRLSALGEAIAGHADDVMNQAATGNVAKLWAVRNIVALDLAVHALRVAWEATGTPQEDRYLLLCFGGPQRSANMVRQQSELSYQRARMKIREATIRTLRDKMSELSRDPETDWEDEFERRSGLEDLVPKLRQTSGPAEFEAIARTVFERANYDRAGEGVRVLLESIGLLHGTGAFRYFSATPELLAAMVGALSSRMPLSSRDFFSALYKEWNVVVSPEAGQKTSLLSTLDGSELARNARRAEALLVDAGVGIALSDSTTMIGERVRRPE
ncbi:hypothetical protein ABNQ39_26690 [Azospirillum sp. A26]|uniref:hypothetical protein n=1 Tax=Azospirillum sp. A26 TaxID=3160607 RepID=UPI00366E0E4B